MRRKASGSKTRTRSVGLSAVDPLPSAHDHRCTVHGRRTEYHSVGGAQAPIRAKKLRTTIKTLIRRAHAPHRNDHHIINSIVTRQNEGAFHYERLAAPIWQPRTGAPACARLALAPFGLAAAITRTNVRRTGGSVVPPGPREALDSPPAFPGLRLRSACGGPEIRKWVLFCLEPCNCGQWVFLRVVGSTKVIRMWRWGIQKLRVQRSARAANVDLHSCGSIGCWNTGFRLGVCVFRGRGLVRPWQDQRGRWGGVCVRFWAGRAWEPRGRRGRLYEGSRTRAVAVGRRSGVCGGGRRRRWILLSEGTAARAPHQLNVRGQRGGLVPAVVVVINTRTALFARALPDESTSESSAFSDAKFMSLVTACSRPCPSSPCTLSDSRRVGIVQRAHPVARVGEMVC
ncbi:hypothetical protein BKA93DRAFT_120177 [Sparassis latifolia]